MSNIERYGFRDQAISAFHRTMGDDCPAVDLDFVLVEYTSGTPAALVEYKHESSKPLKHEHASMRALCVLADRANIPFFITTYSDDLETFRVRGLNALAQRLCPNEKTVTAARYMKFMLDLREREERKNMKNASQTMTNYVAHSATGGGTWHDRDNADEEPHF